MTVAIAAGAAATAMAAQATDRTTFALPPYTTAYTPTTVDERGIWMEADEEERQMRESRSVIKDQALNDYVRHVLCKTVGADRCKPVRLYIVQIPIFQATMSPNGAMTVYSGLLRRMRNEAELGSVLGHEFGHFELRHSLKGFRNRRAGSDIMAWASILIRNSADIRYSAFAHIYAFDRQQERDADMIGFGYLATSDYPSAAAADVWIRVMGESDASAIGRRGRTQHKYVAGVFATHPTDLARATYLRTASLEVGDTGSDDKAAYRAAMAGWLPVFLNDQIRLNDFGGTEYILSELAKDGWTAPLLFARGELYRERANPRDLLSAADFYQQAIDTGHATPEAYRGLGLALMRSQQVDRGRAALVDYLRLDPAAPDAPAIRSLIS